MTNRGIAYKIMLPLLLLLAGAALASIFGGSANAASASKFTFDFSFSLLFEHIYLFAFIVAFVCMAIALLFNPSIIWRQNIKRG